MYRLMLYLCIGVVMGACTTGDDRFERLPEGDAMRGEALYTRTISGAPACSTCHALDDTPMAGPSLAGYGNIAGQRVEGQSAEYYTYEAIVLPARYLVEGYGNLMYAGYGRALNDQQLADLIAYLLEL